MTRGNGYGTFTAFLGLAIGTIAAAQTAAPAFALPPETDASAQARSSGAAAEPDPDAIAHLEQLSEAFASVADAVKPTVVNISSVSSNGAVSRELRKLFPNEKFQHSPVTGTGSGVIFDAAGFIVTNNHVVADADAVRVTLADGRKLRAQVVATDPMTDLAVIKINASGLKAARLGDSDRVRVGHFVLAIGSPFRLGHSVSHGIVSAMGRNDDIEVGIDYKNWLQTDAPINPGNSGGPLINARGEVVGISVAIATENGGHQGVGFAIPSNTVRRVANILKTGEPVVRGYLGVVIQPVDEPMAEAYGLKEVAGVFIGDVGRNSPAARGGLKQEDIVLAIDGRKVRSRDQLQEIIAETKPESAVTLTVWREGREQKLRVTVEEQPDGFRVTGYLSDLNRDGNDESATRRDGGKDTRNNEADAEDESASADEGETEVEKDRSPSPRNRRTNRPPSRQDKGDSKAEDDEKQSRSNRDDSVNGDRKASVAPSGWGFEAATLTPELVRKYRLPSEIEDGVLVTHVDPAGEAWASRLRRGMVIVRANDTAVRLMDDLTAELTPTALKRGIRLKILDRGEAYFLVLRVK